MIRKLFNTFSTLQELSKSVASAPVEGHDGMRGGGGCILPMLYPPAPHCRLQARGSRL